MTQWLTSFMYFCGFIESYDGCCEIVMRDVVAEERACDQIRLPAPRAGNVAS